MVVAHEQQFRLLMSVGLVREAQAKYALVLPTFANREEVYQA
jgi:hypothetical protein